MFRSVQSNGIGDTVLVRGKKYNDANGADFTNVSLSPDGSKVLFVRDRDGDNAMDSRHIYVMNLDGSGEIQLTDSPLGDTSPSFSPDGSRILFRRSGYPEGKLFWELYVMNADGTGQTRLTNNTDYEFSPSFSPDGTRILFHQMGSSGNGGGEQRLFVMNTNGTEQRPFLR